jgi:D-galactarolactone isomerase
MLDSHTCDCHIHVYDPRFPPAGPTARLMTNARVAEYRLHQKRIGTTRTVVVTPSAYADATKVAQASIKAAPQRMVWGSDWPHPTEKEKPTDAVLFDLVAEWAPDEPTRRRLLVENPEVLYGFPRSS